MKVGRLRELLAEFDDEVDVMVSSNVDGDEDASLVASIDLDTIGATDDGEVVFLFAGPQHKVQGG